MIFSDHVTTCPVASPQDFVLLASLKDTSDGITSLTWNKQLLAAGGRDSRVWIWDSSEDLVARQWKHGWVQRRSGVVQFVVMMGNRMHKQSQT